MFFIPGSVIAAITFPGIVVHELAHQLFCRYFRIPVYKVCYFRFGKPAGYVIHGQTANWVQQVLISAGPFFVNSILGAMLAFPSLLRLFEFHSSTAMFDGLLMWLGVSIAMHAIPSVGDAKSMWLAVSGQNAPVLAKLGVAPLVGFSFLLAIGSVFWLDVLYGIAVSVAIPKLLLALLV